MPHCPLNKEFSPNIYSKPALFQFKEGNRFFLMSNFNNPIVKGYTESDTSVQSITESGKCIPAPLCTHWGCRRPRDGIRLLLRGCRPQNARALQQDECSVFPLLKHSTNTGSIIWTTGSRSRVLPEIRSFTAHLTRENSQSQPWLQGQLHAKYVAGFSSQNWNSGLSLFRNIPCYS